MHGLPRKWSLTGTIASAALFLGTLNVLVGKTMYIFGICVYFCLVFLLDCLYAWCVDFRGILLIAL